MQLETNYSSQPLIPLTLSLPPCTLPTSVFAVVSLTLRGFFSSGVTRLWLTPFAPHWHVQLQCQSPILNTHARNEKTNKAIERGVSVKPEPVITIWSSTSDLSAGQHKTLLSAPAPGSRVTAEPSLIPVHIVALRSDKRGAEGEREWHTIG